MASPFIDFELAGPNYRGYDIFKLFRTNALPAGRQTLKLAEFRGGAPRRRRDAARRRRVPPGNEALRAAHVARGGDILLVCSPTLPEKRDEMAALARDRYCVRRLRRGWLRCRCTSGNEAGCLLLFDDHTWQSSPSPDADGAGPLAAAHPPRTCREVVRRNNALQLCRDPGSSASPS